ncbi:MAG: hypothetical protein L0Y54_12835 [Sporichthyaceae bacterium]|nr:hypothetical protein [Sporichthyaceae bacterium]
MDALEILDELERLIEDARMMPMSASCLVNRAEAMELVHQLREALPHELRHAAMLLRDREAMIDEGRREAERVLAAAHEERSRLLAEAEAREADYRPAAVSGGVDREALAIRQEADEYVDQQLANLELILNKALGAVQQGRGRLRNGSEPDFGPAGDFLPRQDYRTDADYSTGEYGQMPDYDPSPEYGSAPDYGSNHDYGPATEYGRPAEYGPVAPERRY